MIKTEINVYAGFDPACPVPRSVTEAGLHHRLAVVQETYRTDAVDMFFDQALWSSLLAFAGAFRPGAQVGVVDRHRLRRRARRDPQESDELPIDAYVSTQANQIEPEPAEYIMVREGRALILCVATEFWTHVGGPKPYADSYTYSIFSRENTSEQVMNHLTAADACAGWHLASEVRMAPKKMRRY